MSRIVLSVAEGVEVSGLSRGGNPESDSWEGKFPGLPRGGTSLGTAAAGEGKFPGLSRGGTHGLPYIHMSYMSYVLHVAPAASRAGLRP